jgi:hypothetical protein
MIIKGQLTRYYLKFLVASFCLKMLLLGENVGDFSWLRTEHVTFRKSGWDYDLCALYRLQRSTLAQKIDSCLCV